MSDWQNTPSGDPPSYTPSGDRHPVIPRYEPDDALHLGPMTLADMLDATFKLLKANWRSIGLVTVLFAVPVSLLSASLTLVQRGDSKFSVFDFSSLGANPETNSGHFGLDIGTILVLLTVSLFITPLVNGVISRIVVSSYLGQSLEAGSAVRGTVKMWPALVAGSVLAHLAILGGFVACIVPGLAFGVLFIVVTPIIAVEECRAVDALGRSWALMKTRFWPYVLTLIVGMALKGFIGAILQVVPLVGAVFAANWFTPLAWVLYVISDLLGYVVSLSVWSVLVTVIYLDTRVRNEGLDVQMMASHLDDRGQRAEGPHESAGPVDEDDLGQGPISS